MSYQVTDSIPTPAEYCGLRQASGLSPMDQSAAAVALPRSLFSVVVRHGTKLIGMGRLVGDGLHVQVVDVAVHPDHQGEGVGRLVMDHIMDFIADGLPDCAVVSLFADVDWLYGKFGFTSPPRSTGLMLTRTPPTEA